MDIERAAEILHHLGIVMQKARSNASEVLAGPNELDKHELSILQDLAPTLFPLDNKIDLLYVVQKAQDIYERTGKIEIQTMYNILFLANREPMIILGYLVTWDDDLPEPMWVYTDSDLKARVQAALKAAGLDDENGPE